MPPIGALWPCVMFGDAGCELLLFFSSATRSDGKIFYAPHLRGFEA